jgi:hypothetical protein
MFFMTRILVINLIIYLIISSNEILIPIGISQTNHHLVIINGHGSHVTLEATQQAQDFGLDMVIVPSHTYEHVFQALDVSCFKSFKIAFKKKIKAMAKNNYLELDKMMLASWVESWIMYCNKVCQRKPLWQGSRSQGCGH